MLPNPDRFALLKSRIAEYEQIIAGFEQTNETIKAKLAQADATAATHYNSQLALNESTIEMMREAMARLRSDLRLEARP
jgi:hypothetical protein